MKATIKCLKNVLSAILAYKNRKYMIHVTCHCPRSTLMHNCLNYVTGPLGMRRYDPDNDSFTVLVYNDLLDTERIDRGFAPVMQAVKGSQKVCLYWLSFISACTVRTLL